MFMKNTLKTTALLGALGGLAVVIGALLGNAFIGLLIGLAIVGFSYWFSASMALKAARAQVITEAEHPAFYGMVRSLAERAEMPMPRVAISPAAQPNAFATGRGPRNAVVCATAGLLETMPRDELEAVMAHELAHVRNRDILIGSIAAAIATGISYVAQIAMFSSMFGGGDDDDNVNPIALIAIMLLAPMAASMIQFAVSRSREFEADRSAAALLGSGEPLARALARIETLAVRAPMPVNPAQASAWIHNPLAEAHASRRGPNVARLFSTHPSTDDRIAALREFDRGRGRHVW
jgi:heat shock protein HtpX